MLNKFTEVLETNYYLITINLKSVMPPVDSITLTAEIYVLYIVRN